MDWSLKDIKKHNHNVVDRLSSLPDELLVHILSLLPTKDAAAISFLSTRLRPVFPSITNLEFDTVTFSHCLNCPYAIRNYSSFVTFVNSVLEAHHSEYLASFRLNVRREDFQFEFYEPRGGYFCEYCSRDDCLPHLNSFHLSSWISFPLTFHGLKVIDLCVVMREPDDVQLPRAIFTSQTLEVLKLELNIGLDQVLAMPSYSLPCLKVLFFTVSFLSDHAFLPRLLASCPLLEDLMYHPFTKHVDHLIMNSISLRRLCLRMDRTSGFHSDSTDYVYIDTPNLEHFEYYDNLARDYSIIINNHSLVKAELFVWDRLELGDELQQLIKLIAPLSHVQHLCLSSRILRMFEAADVNVLKHKLPMFPNMKHLSLDGYVSNIYWDEMLLPLLNCWPVLETLVLPRGIYDRVHRYPEKLELEQKFFRRAHPIPSCCRYHLKTIVIKDYLGRQREYDFTQFFLSHALVLENLIIHYLHDPDLLTPDQGSVESTLRSLPKASVNCSIQVLQSEYS